MPLSTIAILTRCVLNPIDGLPSVHPPPQPPGPPSIHPSIQARIRRHSLSTCPVYTESANKSEKTPVLKLLAFQWKETDNKVKQSRNKVIWAGVKCSEARKQGRVTESLGRGRSGRAFGRVGIWGETAWGGCLGVTFGMEAQVGRLGGRNGWRNLEGPGEWGPRGGGGEGRWGPPPQRDMGWHPQCPPCSTRAAKGYCSCARLPARQLLFQSGDWGRGWAGGGARGQEPDSVLFPVIDRPGARAPRRGAKNTCSPLSRGPCHPATVTHRHLS